MPPGWLLRQLTFDDARARIGEAQVHIGHRINWRLFLLFVPRGTAFLRFLSRILRKLGPHPREAGLAPVGVCRAKRSSGVVCQLSPPREYYLVEPGAHGSTVLTPDCIEPRLTLAG